MLALFAPYISDILLFPITAIFSGGKFIELAKSKNGFFSGLNANFFVVFISNWFTSIGFKYMLLLKIAIFKFLDFAFFIKSIVPSDICLFIDSVPSKSNIIPLIFLSFI